MQRQKSSVEILKEHLARKQEKNPAYSLRALARDLKVSPSYVAAIFGGRKALAPNRVREIGAKLEMDDLNVAVLKRALLLEQLSEDERALLQTTEGSPTSLQFLEQFREEGRQNFKLWSQWYHIAILDLSTTASFQSDAGWIARKLGLTLAEATRALEFLVTSGFLVEREGRLVKADELLRLPTVRSHQTVRDYHKQLMAKAVETMNRATTPEDFERRLISGLVIAANPAKIAEARMRLNVVLHEIAEMLSEGECTELYQLGTQFFPLTRD